MGLENLKPPSGATHSKKRVGRGQGSGNGKTAGRGHKGAKSRSGFKFKRGFEGGQMPLHRRVPKRGFHNPFRVAYEVVNLDTLSATFEAGTVVTPELLIERGLAAVARRRDRLAVDVIGHVACGEHARHVRRGRSGLLEQVAVLVHVEHALERTLTAFVLQEEVRLEPVPAVLDTAVRD